MTKDIGLKALTLNSALKPLERLIGEWQITGFYSYFHGLASFGWREGVEIFGSDNISKEYFMLHPDERDTSRRYGVNVGGMK